MFKGGKQPKRPFQKRINFNTPTLTKISTDIKYMTTPANNTNIF